MSDFTGGMTSAQFLEAARQAGEAIVKATAGWSFSIASLAAADFERVLANGRQLGLTDAEIAEVVNTWTTQTMYSVSDQRVWKAVIDRAAGNEWRPELPNRAA